MKVMYKKIHKKYKNTNAEIFMLTCEFLNNNKYYCLFMINIYNMFNIYFFHKFKIKIFRTILSFSHPKNLCPNYSK